MFSVSDMKDLEHKVREADDFCCDWLIKGLCFLFQI